MIVARSFDSMHSLGDVRSPVSCAEGSVHFLDDSWSHVSCAGTLKEQSTRHAVSSKFEGWVLLQTVSQICVEFRGIAVFRVLRTHTSGRVGDVNVVM